MVMTKRSRALSGERGCDCCNSSMSPHYVKRHRRTIKRRERAAWKREV